MAAIAGSLLAGAAMPGAASALVGPLVPDLAQGIPQNLSVAKVGERYHLQFGAQISNVGKGPVVVAGHGAEGQSAVKAEHVAVNSDGTTQTFPNAGTLHFAGKPPRWGFVDFERFELLRAGREAVLRSDHISGTCIRDEFTVDPPVSGAAALPVESNEDCLTPGQPAGDVFQTLSVGWGFSQPSGTQGQFIDLTGMQPGNYVLRSTVNEERTLFEGNYTNNVATVFFALRRPDGPGGEPTIEVTRESQGVELLHKRYDPGGAYLDWNLRGISVVWPELDQPVKSVDRKRGIHVFTKTLGIDLYSANEDTIYGLWNFTRYAESGDLHNLAEAELAARWLAHKQSPDGKFRYFFGSFNVGGVRPLVLEDGWYGVSTQALAMSLWSRLYRATGKEKYLRRAKLAMRPLTRDIYHGGVASTFLDTGMLFFEGYGTLGLPVHTNSHYLQAVIALYDMADLSNTARTLYREAIKTIPVAIPYFDYGDRINAWLAFLTDPPRDPQPILGEFQEQIVAELGVIQSIYPHPVVEAYRQEWANDLKTICQDPGEICMYPY